MSVFGQNTVADLFHSKKTTRKLEYCESKRHLRVSNLKATKNPMMKSGSAHQ